MQHRDRFFAATMVAIVSIPAFLVGQKLREGEAQAALLILPLALCVVLLASALMRQSE